MQDFAKIKVSQTFPNLHWYLSCYRVDPETKISTLREEIDQQLGSDLVPRDYVFLKSVGRSLTRVSLHWILSGVDSGGCCVLGGGGQGVVIANEDNYVICMDR